MTQPMDPSGMGRMLNDALAALSAFQAAAADGAAPAEAEGAAKDEMVTVRATHPGTLHHLVIDPRLMREGSEAVAEAVLEAANAALVNLRAEQEKGLPGADFTALNEQLKDIQETSSRQFGAFAESLMDAQTRLARYGRDR